MGCAINFKIRKVYQSIHKNLRPKLVKVCSNVTRLSSGRPSPEYSSTHSHGHLWASMDELAFSPSRLLSKGSSAKPCFHTPSIVPFRLARKEHVFTALCHLSHHRPISCSMTRPSAHRVCRELAVSSPRRARRRFLFAK